MQHGIKILLFLILHEAQHVSGDTPPIIRSLKLHKQPLATFAITSCMNSYSEKPNKMQQCTKFYYTLFYMKLNMFRATHKILIPCCILVGFSL